MNSPPSKAKAAIEGALASEMLSPSQKWMRDKVLGCTTGLGVFDRYNEDAQFAVKIYKKGAGHLLALPNAMGTLSLACYLVNNVGRHGVVVNLAFTIDYGPLCEAYLAAIRVAMIYIFVDREWATSSSCKEMVPMLTKLAEAGVKVYCLSGYSLNEAYARANRTSRVPPGRDGHMHAKTLLVNDMMLCGSCNWTVSSSAQVEQGMLVHLTQEGKNQFAENLTEIMRKAQPWSLKLYHEKLAQQTANAAPRGTSGPRRARSNGRGSSRSPSRGRSPSLERRVNQGQALNEPTTEGACGIPRDPRPPVRWFGMGPRGNKTGS